MERLTLKVQIIKLFFQKESSSSRKPKSQSAFDSSLFELIKSSALFVVAGERNQRLKQNLAAARDPDFVFKNLQLKSITELFPSRVPQTSERGEFSSECKYCVCISHQRLPQLKGLADVLDGLGA